MTSQEFRVLLGHIPVYAEDSVIKEEFTRIVRERNPRLLSERMDEFTAHLRDALNIHEEHRSLFNEFM